MLTIELSLPESHAFRRAGFDLSIDLADFPPEVLAQAVVHGLVQTIGDAASAAASGAYETQRGEHAPDWKALPADEKKAWATANAMRIAEHGKALMQKRIAGLQAGDWTMRAPAVDGLDAFQTACAEIVREQMTFDKGMPTKERLRLAYAKYEVQSAEVREAVGRIAKARLDAAKAAQGLGLQLSL